MDHRKDKILRASSLLRLTLMDCKAMRGPKATAWSELEDSTQCQALIVSPSIAAELSAGEMKGQENKFLFMHQMV
jgi:hypothetical protein